MRLRVVDWNVNGFSRGAQPELLGSLEWDVACLQLPTHRLPHALDSLFTTDHIAVPWDAPIADATRVVTDDLRGQRLSDHDLYTTEWTLS